MRFTAAQTGVPLEPNPINWVELSQISPYLACAVVKAEDENFFTHGGFDWEQLRKAFVAGLRNGWRFGSSSITQQLVKNLYLTPERSAARKIQEALITMKLERVLSKRRILELYLNVIEWGPNVWGIGSAAKYYFAKSADALDPFESAVLAALLASPRALPRGRISHRMFFAQRALDKLYFSGLIGPEEWSKAMARFNPLLRRARDGEDLIAALRGSAAGPFSTPMAPLRLNPETMPITRALEEQCGIDRSDQETRELRKIGRAAAR
jgi:monofunctional biosynthetic peptidoglycan transglycosylase